MPYATALFGIRKLSVLAPSVAAGYRRVNTDRHALGIANVGACDGWLKRILSPNDARTQLVEFTYA